MFQISQYVLGSPAEWETHRENLYALKRMNPLSFEYYLVIFEGTACRAATLYHFDSLTDYFRTIMIKLQILIWLTNSTKPCIKF